MQTWNVCTIDTNGREDVLTIDHIVPISKGGKSGKYNLQPLCSKCNNKKGTKTEKYA